MTNHPNRRRVWRNVARALKATLYRKVNGSHNTTACAWLDLECGHRIRETDCSYREINAAIENGKPPRRHCPECAAAGRKR